MSSRIPIAYIDIRVFAHATEDQEKVLCALRNTLPTEFVEKITFKQTRLLGHHGNPIILFEIRVKEKGVAEAVFKQLSSGLERSDKEFLSREIEQHVDKGNLYIRLDKQSAFQNKFKIRSVDPIRVRVHFRKHSLEEIVDICRKSGMLH